MDLELTGHRALVTASSAGIGAAVAARLAAERAFVLVHGRNAERARAVADALRAHGGAVDVVLGDLTDAVQADRVAAAARDHQVDILVNNAGPFTEHDWDSAEPADWLASFDANLVSAVRLIRVLVPSMRDRGWGRVVNIGSRAATAPLANMVDYSAAKAAVVNMTTGLAQHLAGSGVTANTVSPGVIATSGLRRMFETRAAEAGRPARWADLEPEVTAHYAPNPSGRLGTGEDISAVVALLVSPLGGYVNGVDLRVDGGITPVP